MKIIPVLVHSNEYKINILKNNIVKPVFIFKELTTFHTKTVGKEGLFTGYIIPLFQFNVNIKKDIF